MAPHDFTFINRTGNSVLTHQKDDDDIPTIRSHAMREVRRRQGRSSETPVRPKGSTYASALTKTGDRRLLSAYTSSARGISCSRAFSSPYCGTAIEIDGFSVKFSQRLHYFVHGFTHLTFPTTHVRHSCDVLRVAASEGSPALLHALCAISTIHQALSQGTETWDRSPLVAEDQTKTSTAFLYHKQCTITSLQTNLAEHNGIRSRSVLAIVVVLLLIESLSGDVVTADTHRSGLLELVKRYSETQGSLNLLTADVLMTEIKSASSSLSRPSISPCDEWVLAFDMLTYLPFNPHRPDLVSLASGFITTEVGHYLGPDLVLLMCAMRNLVNAVEQNFDLGIDGSDVNGTHFLVLEYKLLSFQSNDRDGPFGGKLQECCRIAALLYCNLFLWSWPKNSTLITNLVSHLQSAISQWTTDPCDHDQMSFRLWLYFIGNFATSDNNTKEHQWYLGGMEDASKRLKIKDEAHFHNILARFFYVDRLMAQHLRTAIPDYLSGHNGII